MKICTCQSYPSRKVRDIPIIPYAIGLHVSNADAIRLRVDISGFADMSPAPAS
jgi:hypothetical protein